MKGQAVQYTVVAAMLARVTWTLFVSTMLWAQTVGDEDFTRMGMESTYLFW